LGPHIAAEALGLHRGEHDWNAENAACFAKQDVERDDGLTVKICNAEQHLGL
jgi:hypothetical protein